MKLFIFDFDHTIVKGHTHNAINQSMAGRGIEQEYVNAPWGVVHDFSTIGSESDWKEIFETLWNQGHFLYIASFNAYGSVIPEFLSKIGLTEDFIAQINIIAKLPKNPQTANKNTYIQQAIQDVRNYCQHHQYTDGTPLEIIFIDDSRKNTEAAQELGCKTILADQYGSHLVKLREEYIAPPVNRDLKPRAAASPGSDEHFHSEEKYIAPPVDRRLKPRAIGADASHGSVEHFFPQESKRIKDPLPPTNRHLKPSLQSQIYPFFSQSHGRDKDIEPLEHDQLPQKLTYR